MSSRKAFKNLECGKNAATLLFVGWRLICSMSFILVWWPWLIGYNHFFIIVWRDYRSTRKNPPAIILMCRLLISILMRPLCVRAAEVPLWRAMCLDLFFSYYSIPYLPGFCCSFGSNSSHHDFEDSYFFLLTEIVSIVLFFHDQHIINLAEKQRSSVRKYILQKYLNLKFKFSCFRGDTTSITSHQRRE